MAKLSDNLRQAVREHLLDQKMTQQQLARRVGVSEKHISKVLCGKDQGSMQLWDTIFEVLTWPSPPSK